MISLTKYTLLSVTVASLAVLHAWSLRQQLYPTMVLLTTSKILVLVLGNLALCLMLCAGKIVKWTFLGQLRESEVERMQDRMKETVMEMCIAMTIFREEFSASFLRYFSFLLFLKVFHWLSSDRVEFLETTPNITVSQHIRCSSLIVSLLLVDILFLREAVIEMTSQGPSVLLLFAFEYIILATACIKLSTKYLFYWIDRFYSGNWAGKSICVLYLDLVTELFQLTVYSIFFCLIFIYYGLPFHLLRDLYWSLRNFKNRLIAFIKYRRITTNMNENFVDATAEDIGENSVCIICREDMVPGSAKKLRCGHVFHSSCLRSWLERQQTCPMCRTSVEPRSQASEQQARRQGDRENAREAGEARDAGEGAGAGERQQEAPNPVIPEGQGQREPVSRPGQQRVVAQREQAPPPPPLERRGVSPLNQVGHDHSGHHANPTTPVPQVTPESRGLHPMPFPFFSPYFAYPPSPYYTSFVVTPEQQAAAIAAAQAAVSPTTPMMPTPEQHAAAMAAAQAAVSSMSPVMPRAEQHAAAMMAAAQTAVSPMSPMMPTAQVPMPPMPAPPQAAAGGEMGRTSSGIGDSTQDEGGSRRLAELREQVQKLSAEIAQFEVRNKTQDPPAANQQGESSQKGPNSSEASQKKPEVSQKEPEVSQEEPDSSEKEPARRMPESSSHQNELRRRRIDRFAD